MGEQHKAGGIPSPASTTRLPLRFHQEQKSLISLSVSKQLSVKMAVRMEVGASDQTAVLVSMDSRVPSAREVRNTFS